MRRFLILMLAISTLASAEPAYRDYLATPTTLASLVEQMDRDFGAQAPHVVETVLDPKAMTAKAADVNSYTIYAARRFAYLEQTPGYLEGLLRNCAIGPQTGWVTGDARVLVLAYASVKSGRAIDGVTFDAAKVYTHVPPKAPPVDPKQLEIK